MAASQKKLKIRLVKSLIGRPEKHRLVARALGLTKTNDTVLRDDSQTIRGMVRKIYHLLSVEVA